jgi:hypothetical protein
LGASIKVNRANSDGLVLPVISAGEFLSMMTYTECPNPGCSTCGTSYQGHGHWAWMELDGKHHSQCTNSWYICEFQLSLESLWGIFQWLNLFMIWQNADRNDERTMAKPKPNHVVLTPPVPDQISNLCLPRFMAIVYKACKARYHVPTISGDETYLIRIANQSKCESTWCQWFNDDSRRILAGFYFIGC